MHKAPQNTIQSQRQEVVAVEEAAAGVEVEEEEEAEDRRCLLVFVFCLFLVFNQNIFLKNKSVACSVGNVDVN